MMRFRHDENSRRWCFRRTTILFLAVGLFGCLHSPTGFGGVLSAYGFIIPSQRRAFRFGSKLLGKQQLIRDAGLPLPIRCDSYLYTKSTLEEGEDGIFVEAEDLEALQELFSKYCDSEGLMTKSSVTLIPAIAELMEDGDLRNEEYNDIWDRAPKFPDVESSEERIDVDSFVQVYRDIDDLFEDEEDEEGDEAFVPPSSAAAAAATITVASSSVGNDTSVDLLDDGEEDETMEAELERIFESFCDENKLVSKGAIKAWDEVAKLLSDGLLGEDEFEDLWVRTKKSPGLNDKLDVDGFLSFNVALDRLFDFDDDDDDDDDEEEEEENDDEDIDADEYSAENVDIVEETPQKQADTEPASTNNMVEGEYLPTGDLFDLLSDSRGRLKRAGLQRWAELNEMLEEGDLLQSELDVLFSKVSKDGKVIGKKEFQTLCRAIDDLFEEDGDDVGEGEEILPTPPSESGSLKEKLLDILEGIEDPELLPCGLECGESDRRNILSIASDLENQANNLVRAREGNIGTDDLAGSWDLLYSSSSAMRHNRGLSGLGGSLPNAKFAGLTQNLKSSKFMADVEYIERIEVNPSSASFEVKVTGDWDLRRSVSLFTSEPSLVLTVEPGQVIYGPTSTKADHWKSLGPMNMLDVTYLDEDLRIMRGNTAVENLFIFRRSS